MIEHVKTKGFKGFDLDEDISPKTLFYGKNRSGKSTRAAAIALAILGYIPFAAKTNKKPADILNDFGFGDSLTVAVVCNGVEFERHFSRSKEGSVSQRLRVDKKKYSAQDFAIVLFKVGDPKIIDVNDFMAMSDQKKIDVLFSLFPPKADLKNLDNKIDRVKKLVNELQASERSATAVIQRLTKSKNEIELPAGTLAEIRAEIEKTTKQVKDAQQALKNAEIEAAEAEATKKANRESQAKFDKIMSENTVPFVPGSSKVSDQTQADYAAPKDPVESIQRILDVLNNAGCEICAAAIVARQELKKFKKGVAA